MVGFRWSRPSHVGKISDLSSFSDHEIENSRTPFEKFTSTYLLTLSYTTSQSSCSKP